MKRIIAGFWLCLVAVLVAAGCGEKYRVEPLLLEKRDVARAIVAGYDDAEVIQRAERFVVRFAKALEKGQCPEAWGMLTGRYRERFATVAGSAEEAQRLFCEGYKVQGEMLVQGSWVTFLLGAQPYYVTTPPPELGVEIRPGEALLYAVQRNGGYTAFLMLDERDGPRVEPF